MITKIDRVLKNYLLGVLGDPGDTVLDFSFKLPDREWLKSAKSSESWINIYLLEVKENLELRKNEWQQSYVGDQVSQQKAPYYVDLYYLITFYNKSKKSEIEHGYLENVLLALFDFPNLAPEHIDDQAFLKEISVELFPKPYIDDQLGFQFWNAIDQDARPYIPLKVTVPLQSTVLKSTAIVNEKEISYNQLTERLYTLSGKVIFVSQINAHTVSVPVVLAEVTIKKKGGDIIDTLQADTVGSFTFKRLKNQAVTILVEAEGYQDQEIDLDDIAMLDSKVVSIEMTK